MMPKPSTSFLHALLVPCLLVFGGMVSAGCEENVEFVTGTSKPFELYGYLDPTADTQRVRIFPIAERLAPNLGEPLDAVVTSTNLETGETIRWRDSLAAYNDGTYGYLFWAPFRATSSHTYRLVARRSDGSESDVTVRIVERPELLEPEVGEQVILPILYKGAQTRVRSVIVDYTLKYGWCGSEFATFSFWHPNAVPIESGELIEIPLTRDRREIRATLDRFDRWQVTYGIVIERITMRTVVTDPAWNPPGGAFDPEVLIDPNAMTNVVHGFGFVGSGYEIAPDIFLSPFVYGQGAPRTALSVEALEAAGFKMTKPPPPIVPGNCVGSWPPVGERP